MKLNYKKYEQDYPSVKIGKSLLINADCFEWLSSVLENSIHSVVTDPPYGVKEYNIDQLEKRENGNGGVWRIPPSFDGNVRSPLPRFTALSNKDREIIKVFFITWSKLINRVLIPGGHLFIASNSYLYPLVIAALLEGGLEYRGTIIRSVRTMRGGDRPKNAEDTYSDVCSLPRGCYEPWGLFRKRLPKNMKVSECLEKYKTGGLRRTKSGNPFEDVIKSERTPQVERKISDHPSLKPQSFLRKIVYSALPLGKGIILDPFMGSGSTVAAAEAIGYQSIGIEIYRDYFDKSCKNVPKLCNIKTDENQINLI